MDQPHSTYTYSRTVTMENWRAGTKTLCSVCTPAVHKDRKSKLWEAFLR